jgi:hypothetical protein
MNGMETWSRRFIAGIAVFASLSGPCFAGTGATEDISKIGTGARPMGMGRAFVSAADDINSVFMNPAGLGRTSGWQITSMYTSLFEGDLNYVVLGASNQFSFGKMGVGMISTGTGQIIYTSPSGATYFDYYDRLFILSYAKADPIKIADNELFAGINLKYFQKGFSGSETNSGRGVDLDIGFAMAMDNGVLLGATAQNILPTSIIWDTGASDSIPAVLKMGVSRRLMEDKLLVAIDTDIPAGRAVPLTFHAGCEYWASSHLALRAGIDQNISAATSVNTGISAGVGLYLQKISFDYAYRPFSEAGLSAAHFISLSLKR